MSGFMECRHAVISGGEGTLGQAIASALQSPGWTVAAPGKNELDVRDPGSVRGFFHERVVDLLVCAAGITRDAPLARMDEAAWDAVWDVNFQGALRCAEAALPGMIERKSGHIVFISSYSANHPPVGQSAYATAKAALLGLVADLAERHGSSNIRINAVMPGFMETGMTKSVSQPRRADVLADHVLGRFNTCEHAAGFIRFLHHDLPHTSGQIFQLDSRL